MLRLAVTNAFGTRVKPVHFVSTNGVFPFSSGETSTYCSIRLSFRPSFRSVLLLLWSSSPSSTLNMSCHVMRCVVLLVAFGLWILVDFGVWPRCLGS